MIKATTTPFTRTLMAAALLAAIGSAHAISLDVGANVDVATDVVADTALLGSVKSKLATDARVKGSDITVNSKNGVLVLTGKAPSAEAKAAAEDIAKASAGASVKVDNRIEAPGLISAISSDVKAATDTTTEVVSDTWISTKIKSQLLADTVTKGTGIKVTTKDNVVFLRGTVATQAEMDQAIKLASETKGVVQVNASKLRVSTKVSSKVN